MPVVSENENPRDLGTDIVSALSLAFLEILALFVIAGHYWLSGWNFDPAESGGFLPVWRHLAAISVIAVLAGFASWRASGRGAKVTAWGQALMAGLIAAVIAAGAAAQVREDHRNRPAPTFTGEVGCRSGDHSDECAHLGG